MSGWMVLGLLTCLSLVGCSSKATVEGTVTYKGKPLEVGTVTFYVGNKTVSASIGEGGKYTAVNVPAGEANVTVQTPAAAGAGGMNNMMSQGMNKMMSQVPEEEKSKFQGASGGGSAKTVPIPKEYADPKSSGLSTPVKAGQNTFNIDLK